MVDGLHMTGVAKAAVPRLGCSLVEAHLQVQFTLMSAELLLSERTLVLLRHLGS